MTWAKVSDTFIDDPRILALPRGIRLLLVEATVWSARHLMDGVLPRHVLPRITDEPDHDAAAARLVKDGFWEESEDAFTIVGYEDEQQTRVQVLKRRDEDAFRQERSRRHRLGQHLLCSKGSSFCPAGYFDTSRRDDWRDYLRESPTPDLTCPDLTSREGRTGKGTGAGAPGSLAVAGTPTPEANQLAAVMAAQRQGHRVIKGNIR